MTSLENANPQVYLINEEAIEEPVEYDDTDASREEFTAQEVFQLIRHLNDPGTVLQCTRFILK